MAAALGDWAFTDGRVGFIAGFGMVLRVDQPCIQPVDGLLAIDDIVEAERFPSEREIAPGAIYLDRTDAADVGYLLPVTWQHPATPDFDAGAGGAGLVVGMAEFGEDFFSPVRDHSVYDAIIEI